MGTKCTKHVKYILDGANQKCLQQIHDIEKE